MCRARAQIANRPLVASTINPRQIQPRKASQYIRIQFTRMDRAPVPELGRGHRQARALAEPRPRPLSLPFHAQDAANTSSILRRGSALGQIFSLPCLPHPVGLLFPLKQPAGE